MSQDLVNLIIAGWGAVTGTIAITLTVMQYVRERPRIRMNWLRGFGILATGIDGQLRDTNRRIARLIVTNVGRQSIRITAAYGVFQQPDKSIKLFMFTDGLFKPGAAKVLSPEQPSTEFHVEESPELDKIVFLGANDGFGDTHGLWLVPWYRRLFMKRRMRLSTPSEQDAAAPSLEA